MSGSLDNTVDRDRALPFNGYQRHHILGMRIDYVSSHDFVIHIGESCLKKASGYICSTDVNQCMVAYSDEQFRNNVVNCANFVITDSFYLNLVRGFLYKVPTLPIFTAARMMPELCKKAADLGFPIALIGGKNDDVLRSLSRNLLARYPTLEIAFAFSPPFRPMTVDEDKALIRDLRASKARLVFVGLGCPKQEKWMAAHRGQVEAMMIGVGAAFDFNADVIAPSPRWVHKIGLEWAYRLMREPRRLWRRYLINGPRFLFLALTKSRSMNRRLGLESQPSDP